MKMNKTRRTFKNEINPGSMADIGFLLLIFFLVSTTINTDQGLLVKLPPFDQNQNPPVVKSRNMCRILVNKNDELYVREEQMKISQLSEYIKIFIWNPGSNPSFASNPTRAIVSLQNDRATSYSKYIEVYNEIKKAYNELRDEQAILIYGLGFDACKPIQKKQIASQIPILLSESEPADFAYQSK